MRYSKTFMAEPPDPLTDKLSHLERTVESLKKWQRRSWFKRTFYRWTPPEAPATMEETAERSKTSVATPAAETAPPVASHPAELTIKMVPYSSVPAIPADLAFAQSVCSEQMIFPVAIERHAHGLFENLVVGCNGLKDDGWCNPMTHLRIGPTYDGDSIVTKWRRTATGKPVDLTISVSGHQPVHAQLPDNHFTLRLAVAADHPVTDVVFHFAESGSVTVDDIRAWNSSACLEFLRIERSAASVHVAKAPTFADFQTRMREAAPFSDEANQLLTSVALSWVAQGRFEEARWLYDYMWSSDAGNRSNPARIIAYFQQLADIAYKQMLRGLARESQETFRQRKEIRMRLAEENAVPDSVVYLGPSWTQAYGDIANLSWAIQDNIMSPTPKKLVLLPWTEKSPNQHLLNYFAPWIETDTSPETRNSLPGILRCRDAWEVSPADILEITHRWSKSGRSALLTLSDEDKQYGAELIKQLGCNPDDWFVCLHVRNAEATDGDLSTRNAVLDTYRDVVKIVTQAGGRVIRIGPKLEPPSDIPNLIDYASGPLRTKQGDLFINVACRFLIGGISGPGSVAEAFGTPLVLTNCYPLNACAFSGHFVCKLLWHEEENRFLTFREMLNEPYCGILSQAVLRERKLRLINNTPEDMCLLLKEALLFHQGSIVYTEEDEALQARFVAIMKTAQPHFIGRLSRDFVYKYRNLL
ncbi:hypothetical protein DB346_04420 [Verrucomicrobia bacterium LW23]|nr:hypothetical protein DB346_04420 [Verrucomicrobia bacterium LW23]